MNMHTITVNLKATKNCSNDGFDSNNLCCSNPSARKKMLQEILPSKEDPYWAYFFGNPAFKFEITLDIGRMGDILFHILW
jgi:hypothetical protein